MLANADALVRRHVGVCGSSKGLSEPAVAFCRALGEGLARHPNLVIASGGTKQRSSVIGLGSGGLSADWHIVSAAMQIIPTIEHAGRIQTFVGTESGSSTLFTAGEARFPRGQTSQARRFSFVRHLDALIAVAGRGGTGQELALASELDIRTLPVPSFGGEAAEHWKAYRVDLLSQLGLPEDRGRAWERKCTSVDCARLLAHEMLAIFLASLPRRCFVITPFHDRYLDLFECVIEPAVRAKGDLPVRLDRLGMPGDVIEQIRQGLRACDYAIAVLDEMRPNVLYELGVAHAWNKPVILLNRRDTLNASTVPFDIAGQQRFEYERIDQKEAERLQSAIASLHDALRATSSKRS